MRTSFVIDTQLYENITQLCVDADLKRDAFFRKAFKAGLKMTKEEFLKKLNFKSKQTQHAFVNLPDELVNEIDDYCKNINTEVNRSDFYRIASMCYYSYLS